MEGGSRGKENSSLILGLGLLTVGQGSHLPGGKRGNRQPGPPEVATSYLPSAPSPEKNHVKKYGNVLSTQVIQTPG